MIVCLLLANCIYIWPYIIMCSMESPNKGHIGDDNNYNNIISPQFSMY